MSNPGWLALAALLLLAGCEKRVAPVTSPSPADSALDARRAELEQKLAALTANGAEVLDRAAYLQEQLGDVLLEQGKKDEAFAQYEKAAAGYVRTPEGTDMPRIRSERVKAKADKLRPNP